MGTAEKKVSVKFEDYLSQEEKATFKSEFYNGEVYAMSGGTYAHGLIGTNFNAELRTALWEKDCFAVGSDLKIRIEAANSSVYPDGMVICGPQEYHQNRSDMVLNPTVVIEVLSDGTAAWDRGGKFRKYQQIPTLKEYVIVEQKTPQVDIFRINSDGFWVLEGYEGLEAVLDLQSLNIQIPISGIYHGVSFDNSPS